MNEVTTADLLAALHATTSADSRARSSVLLHPSGPKDWSTTA